MLEESNLSLGVDPQIDANGLIGLLKNNSEWVAFAAANQADGLSYNPFTRQEFLAYPDVLPTELDTLENQFGVVLIRDVSQADITSAANKLQSAFENDQHHRTLHDMDAKVAATAFLKSEKLATADLRFFKRLIDLGINAEYVGHGRAVQIAATYVARPIVVSK